MDQQSASDKAIDETCTEVSRLLYNIISENQDDNTLEHLRLALRVRKAAGNLKEFVKALNGYITSTLIEMFIEQLIEKYTTEEQRKAFIQEVCKILLDPSYPGKIVAEKISQILNKEPVTEEYSNTSLHLAAEQGNLDAVKYFVEKGSDINAQDEIGYTPLHLAAKQGNLGIIKYLVEKGADVDVYQGGWGYSTPLHLAATNGHLDTVKYLMAKGANPKATDSDGKTPVQRANENGHLGIVEYFASRGLQVTDGQQVTEGQQAMNEDGDTALHLAAMRDDLNAVRYLIEKGADVDAKNKYWATTLHIASIRGNLEIAQFLLDHGANVNFQTINGYAPLHFATERNHLAMVKLLLDHCANVNIKESESYAKHNFGYGTTPLILAVVGCRTEIAKLLLDNGADVTIEARGSTALAFAKQDKCPEMLTLLKDGNTKNIDSRGHCTSTIAASGAVRTSSFINDIFNLVKNILPQNAIALFHSQQPKSSHSRYDVSSSSWTNNNIVNWVSGTNKPSSWINDLCGWVKEKSEVVVSNVVNGLYGGTAKELKGYKSGNIQTGSKKSEKTSSATLLNVSHSGKSPVQGISKENVSNKGWSSSRRKVEGSTNFGAALPKGASSTASSILQVYAQPDITGLMLLVPIFMNTMGRKFVLPLLSADQPISPEKAQVYASNITNGFKEVLEQQAKLKDGIQMHRLNIDFWKIQEVVTGKIMGCKFNEIPEILNSYVEKTLPSRKTGDPGRLSTKKFDKFMAEFNKRLDVALNQPMQQILNNRNSTLEVNDVEEQQGPRSYLNNTSIQGHFTRNKVKLIS